MPSTTKGMCYKMSTIISICGNNFCTFVGDTRRGEITPSGWVYHDDETQKVFKINDRVLFGMTGAYLKDEDIRAAIAGLKSKKNASVEDVKSCVFGYLNKNKKRFTATRTYFVGGKIRSGEFCIHEIRFDVDTRKITFDTWKPSGLSNFGVTCSLPAEMSDRMGHYIERIEHTIRGCVSHGELTDKVVDIIGSIADESESVGRGATVVSVF